MKKNIIIAVSFVVSVCYFAWRAVYTLPNFSWNIQDFWPYIVIVVEMLAFNTGFLYLFLSLRHIDFEGRLKEYRKTFYDSGYPSVDVFIPTYNEPYDVLENTISSAINLDYPNFSVWVLDDGQRDNIKELAEKYNVKYLRRSDRSHAKAGNLNNALQYSKGDYIAILDADFSVTPTFLKEVLPAFQENGVGLVQLPHYFVNHDIFEHGMVNFESIGDEQRFWFDDILRVRNNWDTATSCGSMSIVSRKHLDLVGGHFPDETITEDFDLSIRLLEKGYITRYVNECHGVGLCADDHESFFNQRKRWAAGNIAVWKNHFKRGNYFSLKKYLLIFDWYYLVQVPAKIFLMFVPLVYLMFGLKPFSVLHPVVLFVIHAAFMLINMFTLNKHSHNKYVPFITDAITQICSLVVFPTVLKSLFKPENNFKVTLKGSTTRSKSKTRKSYRIFVNVMIALYVIFLPYRLYYIQDNMSLFYIIAFWSVVSMITLGLMSYILREVELDEEKRNIPNHYQHFNNKRVSKMCSLVCFFVKP